MLASVPSSPRLSDSLETETSNDVSVTPTWAARIAITVAWHDASEALRSQPGFGSELPPPRADGISVDTFSPYGPVTWNFTPFSSTAVAEGFLERAFVGCSAKTLESFSIASRTDVAKASSLGTFKTEAHRDRLCVVATQRRRLTEALSVQARSPCPSAGRSLPDKGQFSTEQLATHQSLAPPDPLNMDRHRQRSYVCARATRGQRPLKALVSRDCHFDCRHTRADPRAIQMTAGQNVKNARRPGPIGFGRIRIRPQPDGREDDDAQQGTATKYEKPEADLEEATLEIAIHGPSGGLCSDFTCQSLLMTTAALSRGRPSACRLQRPVRRRVPRLGFN